MAGLATIAGPTLGGLLVTAFDWRWIFFVNLPIGAAVLSVTFFIIPRFQPGRRHRFDILGVGLASLALLAICYGLVEGQRYDWGTVTSFISIPLIIAVGSGCCSPCSSWSRSCARSESRSSRSPCSGTGTSR